MPAVHSRRVCSARFSSKSYRRWDWASATLYTLAVSSWFWCVTRDPLTRTSSVLPDFFFKNPYFLNFFQHDVRICEDFSPCVLVFSLVDIRPLFSVLLLPKVLIVLKNGLNKNCIKLKFLKKKLVGAYLYLLQEWSKGAPKICQFWDRALEWKSMFT